MGPRPAISQASSPSTEPREGLVVDTDQGAEPHRHRRPSGRVWCGGGACRGVVGESDEGVEVVGGGVLEPTLASSLVEEPVAERSSAVATRAIASTGPLACR